MLIANFPSKSVCVFIALVLVMFSLVRENRGTVVQISNVTLTWTNSDFFFLKHFN